jgi:RES domain-containing protein
MKPCAIAPASVIIDPAQVDVIDRATITNLNWLTPDTPRAGQQEFGAALAEAYVFVFIPSSVSTHSWNVIFDAAKASRLYDKVRQEPFALDTRLRPPARG